VIEMTNAKNVKNETIENVESNENAKTIVHTNDVELYATMRNDASTRRNVRFSHANCAHRDDKNDRAKCRKLMQTQKTTFVYVESTNDKK
jgi:hypothetical protein